MEKSITLVIVSMALEIIFSLARWRALATAASSLVDPESSESSSSSSLTLGTGEDVLLFNPAVPPKASTDLILASDVTTLASVLRSAFHSAVGDIFWPDTDSAEPDRSPRHRCDAFIKDGESDFLSPAGFRSDCTADHNKTKTETKSRLLQFAAPLIDVRWSSTRETRHQT